MSNLAVQQIKDKLNIVEVVERYTQLKKAGSSFRGLSPFTNEKTPSFFVSPDKGLFHCFSSGKGGDIFTFIEEVEGVDFKGALRILADLAGVELVPEKPEEKDRRDRMFDVLEKATRSYQKNLEIRKDVLDYLFQRGLTPATIQEWQIGLAEDKWRGIQDSLKIRDTEILLSTGLLKRGDARTPYDVFRNRIIFPIKDSSGRVIAFTGRIIDPKDDPKYLNTPDTELFQKSDVLFGLDKARTAIHRFGYSILVEGQMDVILLHQAGFKNAVAASGTSLTKNHLKKLAQFSKNCIFCFDSDKAGIRATLRGFQEASEAGLEIKIASLPEGQDPADVVQENKEKFKEFLKESKNIVNFYIDILEKQDLSEEKRRKKMSEELLPIIATVSSEVVKDTYLKIISERMDIATKALWADVSRIKVDTKKDSEVGSSTKNKTVNNYEKSDSILVHIVSLIVWQEQKKEKDINLDKVVQKITDLCGSQKFMNQKEKIQKNVSQISFKAEERFPQGLSEDYMQELILRLEESFISQKITDLQKKIKKIESGKDKEAIKNAIVEMQGLLKERDRVVNNKLKLFVK